MQNRTISLDYIFFVTFLIQIVLYCKKKFLFGNSEFTMCNPFTPMSDQDRISPYNINTISSRQLSDENKEKYSIGD